MNEKKIIVEDYILDKVHILDKIKEVIDFGKFDGIKILIYTADKLPESYPLKNVVVLITCFIKDDGNNVPTKTFRRSFISSIKRLAVLATSAAFVVESEINMVKVSAQFKSFAAQICAKKLEVLTHFSRFS